MAGYARPLTTHLTARKSGTSGMPLEFVTAFLSEFRGLQAKLTQSLGSLPCAGDAGKPSLAATTRALPRYATHVACVAGMPK